MTNRAKPKQRGIDNESMERVHGFGALDGPPKFWLDLTAAEFHQKLDRFEIADRGLSTSIPNPAPYLPIWPEPAINAAIAVSYR